MAAETILFRNAVLVHDGAALSAQLTELSANIKSEMLDRTAFGATTRERRGGLTAGQIDAKGFAQFGSNFIEDTMFNDVGTSEVAIAVFQDGIVEAATSCVGYAMLGAVEHFKVGEAVGALLKVEYSAQSAGLGY